MSDMTTIARPYAKAAFDFAVESQTITQWDEMLGFAAEVAKNEDIKTLLSGSYSPEAISDIFIKVCGEQLNENGQNFLKVLAENGRLIALPTVSEMFAELKAQFDNEIEVEITAATEMSDSQQASLVAALEKRLARKIKLNCKVDSTVVGGAMIVAGDTVIDATVRGKLERLSTTLQS